MVKRFVQCHVLAQSLSGWRPSDKYSQHFASLPICVKMFHSQYSLEETVNHTQSLGSQIYVFFENRDAGWAKKNTNKTNWGRSECCLPRKCLRVPQVRQPLAMASRSCIYKLTDRRCTVPDRYYPKQSDDYVAEPPRMRFACRRISWQSMG